VRSRSEIAADIEREEARLAELRRRADEAAARLAVLREELAVIPQGQLSIVSEPASAPPSTPTSNAQKIALFRSLFCGREDVFARRWQNPKTGKSGYSPTCANEWNRGVCAKGMGAIRRATCGDCANQAFVPMDDHQIAGHLRGDHVIGVYPLLADETCWFLAADFDQRSWQEDVAAFAETCDAQGVPVAIERSRSGNGAHAWIFFASPVPAVAARKLGCLLITEAMARRHQLSMESYDRLFPNQDTIPKGGFGNLIALPLQRAEREQANSVFVDQSLVPFPDQWAFLAGARRLAPDRVHDLVDGASRRGQVLGVRPSNVQDEDGGEPWLLSPSRRPPRLVLTEPLPPTVRAVLRQRLFVEKAGLPSPLLNQLKRLAAFQNPEFYARQNLRLSTALTPRVISCAEDLAEHVALPRGCVADAEDLLREHGARLHVQEARDEGAPLDCTFHGSLTPVQEQALAVLVEHDIGVFVAPPGVGKTVVAIGLIAARGRSTLVLVHRKPLLDQWIARLAVFLGVERQEIGQIGAGKSRPNGRLDVAMLQSLVRKGEVSDLVAGYGQVIVDEAHHCPAVSFERVLGEVKARYVVGLTATPQRRDGRHPITTMQLGPVRFRIDSRSRTARPPFEHRLLVRETAFTPGALPDGAGIQDLYAALAADQDRNDLIFDDMLSALEEGRSPILLTERRDHLEHFAARLRHFTRHLVVLHGRMKPAERRDVLARLAAIPDGEERLLLATGRYIGEGFDDSRLDTLFLALPVAWKGTLVQYAGRLHRSRPGKTDVRIFDYVDREVPVLRRMFEKRLRGYRAIGYHLKEDHGATPEA